MVYRSNVLYHGQRGVARASTNYNTPAFVYTSCRGRLTTSFSFTNSCCMLFHHTNRRHPLHRTRTPKRKSLYQALASIPSKPSYVIHTLDGDDEDVVTLSSSSESSNTSVSGEPLPGPDPPFLLDCKMCQNTGFINCSTCKSEGVVRNERSGNVFYCPDCVGHKKLRCPSCGGKCYMCE